MESFAFVNRRKVLGLQNYKKSHENGNFSGSPSVVSLLTILV